MKLTVFDHWTHADGTVDQVFSEAVNRNDLPVSVAAVTLLDRWFRLTDDNVLGQIDASVGETGELSRLVREYRRPILPAAAELSCRIARWPEESLAR